jgi:hypothetical protein
MDKYKIINDIGVKKVIYKKIIDIHGRSPEEKEALKKVLEIAKKWGYGNVIQFTQEAYAIRMLNEGMDSYQAGLHAGMSKADAEYFAKGYRLP